MKSRHVLIAALTVALLLPTVALSHCQVPCGIYDDAARITMMIEDTKTMAKADMMIGELAGATDANSLNQLNRWVMTKEIHASSIISIMSEYFLAQRVKPVAPEVVGYDRYLVKLAEHHAVIVAAMKAKQDADPATVFALAGAIGEIKKHYKMEEH